MLADKQREFIGKKLGICRTHTKGGETWSGNQQHGGLAPYWLSIASNFLSYSGEIPIICSIIVSVLNYRSPKEALSFSPSAPGNQRAGK